MQADSYKTTCEIKYGQGVMEGPRMGTFFGGNPGRLLGGGSFSAVRR
jgi:hypothetical protein